jgi:Na+/proline symporter
MATAAATEASAGNRIRWGRVVGLAIALEAALFAALVPLQSVLRLNSWFVAVAIGCAVFSYAAGRLAGRRLTSRSVQHGLLVGLIATSIYLAICILAPGGLAAAVTLYGLPLFVLLNALRIAGCTVGSIQLRH